MEKSASLSQNLPWEILVADSDDDHPSFISLETFTHSHICDGLQLPSLPQPSIKDLFLGQSSLNAPNMSNTILLYVACALCGSYMPEVFSPHYPDREPPRDPHSCKTSGIEHEVIKNLITLTKSIEGTSIESHCRRLSELRNLCLKAGPHRQMSLECIERLLSNVNIIRVVENYIYSSKNSNVSLQNDCVGQADGALSPLFTSFAPWITTKRDELAFLYDRFNKGELNNVFPNIISPNQINPPRFRLDHHRAFRDSVFASRAFALVNSFAYEQRVQFGLLAKSEKKPSFDLPEITSSSSNRPSLFNILTQNSEDRLKIFNRIFYPNRPIEPIGILSALLLLMAPCLNDNEGEIHLMVTFLRILDENNGIEVLKIATDLHTFLRGKNIDWNASGNTSILMNSCTLRRDQTSPRAVLLSHLFSDATECLTEVTSLLDLSSSNDHSEYSFLSRDKSDKHWRSSNDIRPLSHILCNFSGTLLHCLFEHRAHIDTYFGHRYSSESTVSWVRTMLRSNCDEGGLKRQPMSRYGNLPSTICPVNGMVHRDELVESLDGGARREGLNKMTNVPRSLTSSLIRPLLIPEDSDLLTASSLPITAHISELLGVINSNNVLCVNGETGCGKSSIIPLEIYKDAVARDLDVNIVVTQPRRIAAQALATRVASLVGEEIGGVVGYRIGRNVKKVSERTRIMFVTTGYLLESMLRHPGRWANVTHFILDEVHERSLEADMLALVIKTSLGRRMGLYLDDLQALDRESLYWEEKKSVQSTTDSIPSPSAQLSDCKLIIMSATIQAKLFQIYFSPLMQEKFLAPNVFVGSKRFSVQEYFLDEFIESFPQLDNALKLSIASHNANCIRSIKNSAVPSLTNASVTIIISVTQQFVAPKTTILIFVAGIAEIESVTKGLRSARYPVNVRIVNMHSLIDPDDSSASVTTPGEPSSDECTIIVTTNIAETSLTIPSLKVIIDTGLYKRVHYNQNSKRCQLVRSWCSRSSSTQRAGRTGRLGPGVVVRLYPRQVYNKMDDFDPSELAPWNNSILQVCHYLSHLGTIEHVMAMLIQPPQNFQIFKSEIQSLVRANLMERNGQLTSLLPAGRAALALPLNWKLTQSILAAVNFGCAAEMVIISAGISMNVSLISRPPTSSYDSIRDYVSSVTNAVSTARIFEHTTFSDVHQYLSIFSFATSHPKSQDKRVNGEQRKYISFRNINMFVNQSRYIASRLLELEFDFAKNIPVEADFPKDNLPFLQIALAVGSEVHGTMNWGKSPSGTPVRLHIPGSDNPPVSLPMIVSKCDSIVNHTKSLKSLKKCVKGIQNALDQVLPGKRWGIETFPSNDSTNGQPLKLADSLTGFLIARKALYRVNWIGKNKLICLQALNSNQCGANLFDTWSALNEASTFLPQQSPQMHAIAFQNGSPLSSALLVQGTAEEICMSVMFSPSVRNHIRNSKALNFSLSRESNISLHLHVGRENTMSFPNVTFDIFVKLIAAMILTDIPLKSDHRSSLLSIVGSRHPPNGSYQQDGSTRRKHR